MTSKLTKGQIDLTDPKAVVKALKAVTTDISKAKRPDGRKVIDRTAPVILRTIMKDWHHRKWIPNTNIATTRAVKDALIQAKVNLKLKDDKTGNNLEAARTGFYKRAYGPDLGKWIQEHFHKDPAMTTPMADIEDLAALTIPDFQAFFDKKDLRSQGKSAPGFAACLVKVWGFDSIDAIVGKDESGRNLWRAAVKGIHLNVKARKKLEKSRVPQSLEAEMDVLPGLLQPEENMEVEFADSAVKQLLDNGKNHGIARPDYQKVLDGLETEIKIERLATKDDIESLKNHFSEVVSELIKALTGDK